MTVQHSGVSLASLTLVQAEGGFIHRECDGNAKIIKTVSHAG